MIAMFLTSYKVVHDLFICLLNHDYLDKACALDLDINQISQCNVINALASAWGSVKMKISLKSEGACQCF